LLESASLGVLISSRDKNRSPLRLHDKVAVSDPAAIRAFDLSAHGGVLAFAAALAAAS
jgi:hypothetical protein